MRDVGGFLPGVALRAKPAMCCDAPHIDPVPYDSFCVKDKKQMEDDAMKHEMQHETDERILQSVWPKVPPHVTCTRVRRSSGKGW